MNLKFSIITVCFNSERTIKDTVDSVVKQTYKNYEHIIIDGASTDNTVKIIEKYNKSSDKVNFISEIDQGIYDAMNKGIKVAKGDLIVFLNSDDTFEKEALEVINKNYTDDIDLIFGDVYWYEKYKGTLYEKKLIISFPKIIDDKKMIPHNSTFVKSSIMKENLFDTKLKICSDYKFFLAMYKQQRKIKYVPSRITNMMMGGISTTQLKLGLEEHINCQLEVLGYSDINIKKRKREIKLAIFLKYISNLILPSNIYIRYRYINRGWKIKH